MSSLYPYTNWDKSKKMNNQETYNKTTKILNNTVNLFKFL